MKAVALSITDTKIVDITHNISPHNIQEAAFVLENSVPYFPNGTVHVAVVDPGVGSNQRGLVIATSTQILIGPDNGILIPVAKKLGFFTAYEIKNSQLMRRNVSNTFHGRDVYTPVAAHILNGVYFVDIGPVIKDYIELDFEKSEITDNTAKGKIIHIDAFGNIITNIDGMELWQLIGFDRSMMIYIGKNQIQIPFVKTYSFVNKNDLLATVGSSNYLEISMNMGNAAKKLKIKTDDEIKILFN
jgi:S-adenosylmethionine hydrolase